MKAKIEPCIKVGSGVFFIDSVVTVTYCDRTYVEESSGRLSEIDDEEGSIKLDMSSNFKSDTKVIYISKIINIREFVEESTGLFGNDEVII